MILFGTKMYAFQFKPEFVAMFKKNKSRAEQGDIHTHTHTEDRCRQIGTGPRWFDDDIVLIEHLE